MLQSDCLPVGSQHRSCNCHSCYSSYTFVPLKVLPDSVVAEYDALYSAGSEHNAFLDRKQDAIEEATRAVDLCKDAVERPFILENLATVYAWTNEPDLAFRTLAILSETPPHPVREVVKNNPEWDPIRKDARFDKLVAQLRQFP